MLHPSAKFWITAGCISAGIAVAMGAMAAHGLEGWLDKNYPDDIEKRIANWKTAASYQMYHSLGVILVGLISNQLRNSRTIASAASMMLLGIVLFSGMLYGWVLFDSFVMVMIVPLGGMLWIASWILLAIGAATAQTLPASLENGNV